MESIASFILSPIRDFVFSTECFHCGEQLGDSESRICDSCWHSLVSVEPDDHTYKIMLQRFQKDGIIDEFIPLYYFESGKALQSLIHSLKYADVTAFGKELGEKIGNLLRERNVLFDAIIPVPLNKRKERERGYNQSEYIVNGISLVTQVPVVPHAVKRVKYTTTQTHLNANQRKENISDAFSINQKYLHLIKDKSIVIVDDIITTGSTIQEVGKVVKKFGAKKVITASAGLAKLEENV